MKNEITLTMTKKEVFDLTEAYVTKKIYELHGVDSFTTPELLGFPWSPETKPFCLLYETEDVAGKQIGKLVKRVAKRMGFTAKHEICKIWGITRYYM